jgi:hypothetical protein
MRVIFAETLRKDGTSIDELTTVEIDAEASQAFFSNPWRMSEDILLVSRSCPRKIGCTRLQISNCSRFVR